MPSRILVVKITCCREYPSPMPSRILVVKIHAAENIHPSCLAEYWLLRSHVAENIHPPCQAEYWLLRYMRQRISIPHASRILVVNITCCREYPPPMPSRTLVVKITYCREYPFPMPSRILVVKITCCWDYPSTMPSRILVVKITCCHRMFLPVPKSVVTISKSDSFCYCSLLFHRRSLGAFNGRQLKSYMSCSTKSKFSNSIFCSRLTKQSEALSIPNKRIQGTKSCNWYYR